MSDYFKHQYQTPEALNLTIVNTSMYDAVPLCPFILGDHCGQL